jgi:hypothetical protein
LVFTKLTKRTTLRKCSFDKGIEGSEAKTDINEVAEGAGGIDKLSKNSIMVAVRHALDTTGWNSWLGRNFRIDGI